MSTSYAVLKHSKIWTLIDIEKAQARSVKEFDHFPTEEEVEVALAMSRTLNRG